MKSLRTLITFHKVEKESYGGGGGGTIFGGGGGGGIDAAIIQTNQNVTFQNITTKSCS